MIKKVQDMLDRLEGQEIYYLCSTCRVEKGVLHDAGQDMPDQIDLYAMSEGELENLSCTLEELV